MFSNVHRNFVASIFIRGIGAALALVVNIILARLLGVMEYGRYATLWSVTLVLGVLSIRGADLLLTREFSAGAAVDPSWRSMLRHWTGKRIAVGILIASTIYLLWLYATSSRLINSSFWATALVGMMIIVILNLCYLIAGVINGYGASLRSQSLLLLVKNAGVLSILAILYVLSGGIRSGMFALGLQLGGLIITLSLGWYWLRKCKEEIRVPVTGTNRSENVRGSQKLWSRAARDLFLVVLATSLVNRLDVVLVSAVGSEEAVGIYAAGARLAEAAIMVALAVAVVLRPRISLAWAHKDMAKVRRLLRGGFAFTVPVAVCEIVIVVLFGQDITAVFGTSYTASTAVFIWVTVSFALWAVAAPAYALLTMTGSEKTVAAVCWLEVLINIVGIFVLVPRIGATGAGITMAVSSITTLPIVLFATLKKIKRSAIERAPHNTVA